VTRRVFDYFSESGWVRHSCNCKDFRADLWKDIQVDTLPDDDQECHVLLSKWCDTCGDEFCRAVLNREKRPEGRVIA
jgi:hypothetical protein